VTKVHYLILLIGCVVGSDNSDKGEGGKKYKNILGTSCINGPLRKFGFFDGQNDRHLTGEGS